jgi:hypothetical protein
MPNRSQAYEPEVPVKMRERIFVASVVGAALMTGASSAQAAAPARAAANAPPAPLAQLNKKPQNVVAPSIVVAVTNSRSVELTKLDATPSIGTLPTRTIVFNLAPGKKIFVTVATGKFCVFDLHGAYADGSSTDSTNVDFCKDNTLNLVE